MSVGAASLAALRQVAHLHALGRLDEAETLARQALVVDPQHAGLLLQLSVVLISAKRHDEGLAVAEAAVAVAPESEGPHRVRALHLAQLGRHEEATRAAYHAATIAPQKPEAALGYSVVLQLAGHLEQAQQVARHAVSLAPNDAATHLRMADVAANRGDLVLARTAYTEALRLDPTSSAARNDLAVLDLRLNRPGRALGGLVEAGRLDPTSTLVLHNVGAVLWRLAWQIRIWLVLLTFVVIGATTDPVVARVGAGGALLGIALVVRLSTRGLPAGTARVAREALRRDWALTVDLIALAACVACFVVVLATAWVPLVGLAWLLLAASGLLSFVVGLVRGVARRRRPSG